MTNTYRLVASIVLALCVALPLLPTALDDDGAGGATGNGVETSPGSTTTSDGNDPDGDDPNSDDPETTDPNGDDPSSDTDLDSDDPDTDPDDPDTDPDGDDPDASDPGGADPGSADPSSPLNPPITTRGPTSTSGPPPPTSLAINPIGALAAGRTGTVEVVITSTQPPAGAVTVRVAITGATITGLPPECRATSPVECDLTLPANAVATLTFRLAVDANPTDGVGVAINATTQATPNPNAVATVIPVAASTAFASTYRTSGSFDAAVVGNTLLSCPAGTSSGGITCDAARAGVAVSTNDAWTMAAVRADDRGTGSSSAADLAIGTATVERAFLVWGASATGALPAGARDILLATPATTGAVPSSAGDYRSIEADEVIAANGGWQAIADVTSLVADGGAGTYWVADIASSTGGDQWAGWTLVVVHADNTERDISLLVGLAQLADGDVAVPVTAPPSGRSSALTVVAWDGDRGATGDRLRIAGTGANGSDTVTVSNPTNPADDWANSSITRDGTHTSDRSPSDQNTLGVDVDTFSLAFDGPRPTLVAGGTDDALLGVVVTATPRS